MKRHLSTYTLTVLIAVTSAATWVAAAPAQPRDPCCAKQFGEADGTRSGEGQVQRHTRIRAQSDSGAQANVGLGVGVGACDSDLDSRQS